MKAMIMTRPGGPEVLEYAEIETPRLTSPTQVLVRIKAAGVNPVDTKVRARGLFAPGATLPAVIGCDGAGVVVECGSGVDRFRPGDEVWFCHGGLGGEPGCYAEFKAIEQHLVQLKPKTLSFEEAAAAPLVLITDWEALYDRGHLAEGQTVLIHAGAGGTGHLAIQLARLRGARVCTTVSTAEKAAFVRGLGAEEVIRYRDEDVKARVMAWTSGRGADLVYDTVGPEVFNASIPLTAVYGTLVTLLDPGAEVAMKEARNRNLSLAFTLMLTPMLMGLPEALERQQAMLRQCAQWFDEGRLRIHVERVFDLGQAAEAHRLVEAGHVQGKVVLRIP